MKDTINTWFQNDIKPQLNLSNFSVCKGKNGVNVEFHFNGKILIDKIAYDFVILFSG